MPVCSLQAAFNYSLNVNGSSQYVSVPASASLTPSSSFTLEAWINVPGIGKQTIVSRGNGNDSSTDYILQLSNNGGSSGNQVSLYSGGFWDDSTSTVPLNTWTHVAVTFDGKNKQFYINGVLDRTAPRTDSISSTPGSPMFIGRQGSVCNCNFFNGLIAEVRVWNGIRTAAQINSDMSFSLSGTQPGLVAYYHLNDGSGTTATDSSGNGHTGTLQNGASWTGFGPPSLGTTALLEGPAAGIDSVALQDVSNAWTASTNASWLHLGTAYQSGTTSTNVIFSFDANPGITRTGTLTIAGLTLTVTQAGSTYVPAPAPVTTLLKTSYFSGLSADSVGNIFYSDGISNAVYEWSVTNGTVTALVTGLSYLGGAAVDAAGNVYFSDGTNGPGGFGYYSLQKWTATNHAVTTLAPISTGGVAVDPWGNLYFADSVSGQPGICIQQWSAQTKNLTTLVTGIGSAGGVAADGAGTVYFTDYNQGTFWKWLPATQSLILLGSSLYGTMGVAADAGGNGYVAEFNGYAVGKWLAVSNYLSQIGVYPLTPELVTVDGLGNLYYVDGQTGNLREIVRAFVDPTTRMESAASGTDALPVVLPANENLGGLFAPGSDQSWLTITGVTNGIVSFAFPVNLGGSRTAHITVLGQQISVTQAATVNSGVLGIANRLVGPAAGSDSVILATSNTWVAGPNDSWLHLSAGYQFGTSSTNVVFSFDANSGPTRTGTLTIAGQTLTVTQAGSTYVAAPGPLTVLAGGLSTPEGLALDGAGNVYIADGFHNAIQKWSVANNTVTAFVSSGLNNPQGVALDGAGNVYIADTYDNAIKEWSGGTLTTLASGLSSPQGIAVDSAGNVYFTDFAANAIKEWVAVSNQVFTVVSGLNHPGGVALDSAGNLYIADSFNNAIKERVGTNNSIITLPIAGLNTPEGVAVDVAGNVYVSDTFNNAVKEWVVASNMVVTLVSSGLNQPNGISVDGKGNVYFVDSGNNVVKELPRAFVDSTPKVEGAPGGSDALPVVLPATENLLPPFAPTSSQPWLGISGVNSGVVSFAFPFNLGPQRVANITLLGQSVLVTQVAAANTGVLGTTNIVEGPAAGIDSVILSSPGTTWTATNSSSWLHLGVTNQSGIGSTNIIFSFDANSGLPRTGTMTIAGQTVTVTQAGSTYVPAASVPIFVGQVGSVAVDNADNVYFANNDSNNVYSIKELVASSNTLVSLVAGNFGGLAVDGGGNVYFTDGVSNIFEWSSVTKTVTNLISSVLFQPGPLAVDASGNVYISIYYSNAVFEWSAQSQTVSRLVYLVPSPEGVALDSLGNVYVASLANRIYKWSPATSNLTTVVPSGFDYSGSVAVDGGGNLFIADYTGIKQWSFASRSLTQRLSWSLINSYTMAMDRAGNLFFVLQGAKGGVEELPHAFVDPTPKWETLDAGNDALPMVVPSNQNLLPPVAPSSDQPWLTITGITNGVVSFAFTASTTNRTAHISLLGQSIPILQFDDMLSTNVIYVGPGAGSNGVTLIVAPAGPQGWTASSQAAWLHLDTTSGSGTTPVSFTYDANPGATRSNSLTIGGQTLIVIQEAFSLGTSTRVEGPAAGMDSVVLASLNTPWTATTNDPWLHLSPANQSGTGSTNVIFSFDANTNAIRTGTLTIAGLTLTVTQAGSTYIAAHPPFTTLVSSNLSNPNAVAVDAAGNVYIADTGHSAIKEWSPASNTVTTLPIPGLSAPYGVAVDGAGNVYIADTGHAAVKEWSPVSQTVTTLASASAGLNQPAAVAVDGLGNVYIVDYNTNAIFEWVAASQSLTTLVSSNFSEPYDVAVDGAGNLYIADFSGAIYEWPVQSQTPTQLVSSVSIYASSVGVDGAGNVFTVDGNTGKIAEWVAASNTIVTLPSSTVSANTTKVDADGNIYAANYNNTMAELPRAFVDPTAKSENAAGGSDVLPVVLPATTDLQGPFAPTTNQTWLTINGVTNGVVSFGFAANTGAARSGNISLLGTNILIQQYAGVGVATRLTGTRMMGNGSLQFSFTNVPGAPFTIMTSTNASLPLSNWTSLGAPVEGPAGQYQFTDPAPTNATRFYIFVSP